MRYVFIGLVWLYRVCVSPFLPSRCKFVPSCSAYALEKLQTLPLLRALWLIVKRLCKCHPFNSHKGYDP